MSLEPRIARILTLLLLELTEPRSRFEEIVCFWRLGVLEANLYKVVRGMSKRTIAKRTRVKPFVKVVNMQHVMPTRFTMDIDLRGVVNASSLEPARRRYTKRAVRTQFEARHRSGQSAWFFSKLRF